MYLKRHDTNQQRRETCAAFSAFSCRAFGAAGGGCACHLVAEARGADGGTSQCARSPQPRLIRPPKWRPPPAKAVPSGRERTGSEPAPSRCAPGPPAFGVGGGEEAGPLGERCLGAAGASRRELCRRLSSTSARAVRHAWSRRHGQEPADDGNSARRPRCQLRAAANKVTVFEELMDRRENLAGNLESGKSNSRF